MLEAVAELTNEGERSSAVASGAGQPLEEVLTRWGMNPSAWLTQLEQLDRQCTRALGAAHRVLQRAGEAAQRWFHGIGWCREVFVDSPSDAFT